MDYRKLINLDKWSGSYGYCHFYMTLKPNTTYKLSMTENNMYKGYKEEYDGKFALYFGKTANTPGEIMVGNTNSSKQPTEKTFTTKENQYYINLFLLAFNSTNLHIVFDELLPNIKLEEVTT